MKNKTIINDELLELNKKQGVFYDTQPKKRKFTLAMHLWRYPKGKMWQLIQNAGIMQEVIQKQKEWMGDLSKKKILDFGCYDGNILSGYLAANCSKYIGIDLSFEALKRLDTCFRKKDIKNYTLQSVDILSSDFTETDFDIIYASGVLHHFKPIRRVLDVLSNKLSAEGKIISLDPLQTCFLTQTVRNLYRPFRTDKEWEWPFTHDTFSQIKEHFRISAMQGIMGYSKWAIPMAFINYKSALSLAESLHKKDMAYANKEGPALFQCMEVSLMLEKL